MISFSAAIQHTITFAFLTLTAIGLFVWEKRQNVIGRKPLERLTLILNTFFDMRNLRYSQILEVTVQQFYHGSDVLKASARHGSLDAFNTVSQILKTKLKLDQVCLF